MTVILPSLEVELGLAARHGAGRRVIVGIDEVGRGALAGPVAVGACALEVVDGVIAPLPDGIRDSKALTARRREALVAPILETVHAGAVGWSSPAEIDEIGIMPALTRAALRALEALGPDVVADAIVLDGDVDVLSPALAAADRPAPLVHLQVAADRDCASVAAASILAKVARDAHMVELHAEAPHYCWAANKGYGSAAHRAAIDERGVHVHHRRSWRLGSRAAEAPSSPVVAPPPRSSRVTPAATAEPVPAGVLWDDQWSLQDRKERR